jgi:hypothetical protein
VDNKWLSIDLCTLCFLFGKNEAQCVVFGKLLLSAVLHCTRSRSR